MSGKSAPGALIVVLALHSAAERLERDARELKEAERHSGMVPGVLYSVARLRQLAEVMERGYQ